MCMRSQCFGPTRAPCAASGCQREWREVSSGTNGCQPYERILLWKKGEDVVPKKIPIIPASLSPSSEPAYSVPQFIGTLARLQLPLLEGTIFQASIHVPQLHRRNFFKEAIDPSPSAS